MLLTLILITEYFFPFLCVVYIITDLIECLQAQLNPDKVGMLSPDYPAFLQS